MTPQVFVEQKAPQLIYFINHFLTHSITFRELEIFAWDILEEWNNIECDNKSHPTDDESVFWHLLYLLQSENEESLLKDMGVKEQVTKCIHYLSEESSDVPNGCVGVRP